MAGAASMVTSAWAEARPRSLHRRCYRRVRKKKRSGQVVDNEMGNPIRQERAMTDRPVRQPTAEHPITVEPTGKHVTVRVNGEVVADTDDALTLQESTYPAVHYIPIRDVVQDVLKPSDTTTYCPYKGDASYYHVTTRLGRHRRGRDLDLRAALSRGRRHRRSRRVLSGQGRHRRRVLAAGAHQVAPFGAGQVVAPQPRRAQPRKLNRNRCHYCVITVPGHRVERRPNDSSGAQRGVSGTRESRR